MQSSICYSRVSYGRTHDTSTCPLISSQYSWMISLLQVKCYYLRASHGGVCFSEIKAVDVICGRAFQLTCLLSCLLFTSAYMPCRYHLKQQSLSQFRASCGGANVSKKHLVRQHMCFLHAPSHMHLAFLCADLPSPFDSFPSTPGFLTLQY